MVLGCSIRRHGRTGKSVDDYSQARSQSDWAWLTQVASHELAQQKLSAAQTVAAQLSQVGLSAAPSSQVSWTQASPPPSPPAEAAIARSCLPAAPETNGLWRESDPMSRASQANGATRRRSAPTRSSSRYSPPTTRAALSLAGRSSSMTVTMRVVRVGSAPDTTVVLGPEVSDTQWSVTSTNTKPAALVFQM